MKKVYFSFGLLTLLSILYIAQNRPEEADFVLPRLKTQGNQIISVETGKSFVLKAVTSDYFRHGFNQDYPLHTGGLEKEFERLAILEQIGAKINAVTLYLADLKRTEASIAELDRYIKYAGTHGLYVILAPAGVGFFETNPKKANMPDETYWAGIEGGDLAALTKLIATRYGSLPHTLFYLVAEPSLSQTEWLPIERKLAGIVRAESENIIVASIPYYQKYLDLPAIIAGNIAYSTGGYVRHNDTAPRERAVEQILGQDNLRASYPVIVSEFGGNYNKDFSSAADLAAFEEILSAINNAELSYSVYRLSASSLGDGLSLFTMGNQLTAKGEIFVKLFR